MNALWPWMGTATSNGKLVLMAVRQTAFKPSAFHSSFPFAVMLFTLIKSLLERIAPWGGVITNRELLLCHHEKRATRPDAAVQMRPKDATKLEPVSVAGD